MGRSGISRSGGASLEPPADTACALIRCCNAVVNARQEVKPEVVVVRLCGTRAEVGERFVRRWDVQAQLAISLSDPRRRSFRVFE